VSAKIPQQGLLAFANLINANVVGDLYVGLYTNNYTPAIGSVLTSFTELVGTGYALQPLGAAGTPVWNPGSNTYNTPYGPAIFTNTGGTSWTPVYGYYVTDATVVWWAELMAGGPFTIAAGLAMVVVPSLDTLGEF
jgi:hypothetical protein